MSYEKPYSYQQDFINNFFNEYRRGTRRMLGVMPTGTGKTIVFAEIAKQMNLRTLILAHRNELILQAVEKLKFVWPGCDVGIVKAELNQTNHQVVVASVQSLYKRRLEQLHPFGLVITDEAHHAAAPSYRRIYHRFGLLDESPDDPALAQLNCNAVHLGVTATPNRSDKQGLKPIFDEIIYDAKLFHFVPKYLSDLMLRGVKANLDFSQVRVSRLTRDFDERQLAEIMNDQSVNNHILKAYRDFAGGRKRTLVFCVNRDHAFCMYENFAANGVNSGYVDFKTPADQRKQTIEDFRDGKIQAMFNVGIFTEGFDLPEIDCIIIAKPTRSSLLLTQMIGRGTRNAPGKENCLIIDVAMYQRGDSAVSVASMFNIHPSVLAFDPDKTVGQAIVESGTRGSGYLDAEAEQPAPPAYGVELTLDSIFAIRDKFQATEDWHSLPATEKQIHLLTRQLASIGEPPLEGNISRGQASEMIDAIFNSELATQKQLQYLINLGVKFNKNITKRQAHTLIDETLAKKKKAQNAA